jgi:hypothetical protein
VNQKVGLWSNTLTDLAIFDPKVAKSVKVSLHKPIFKGSKAKPYQINPILIYFGLAGWAGWLSWLAGLAELAGLTG